MLIENIGSLAIPRESVPSQHKILPSVWSMTRKHDIKTQKVYKWEARLNIHGRKHVHRVNYTETFLPVVNWITARLILILSLIYQWKTRQVDFFLVFPQADIKCPMFMELPTGIEMKKGGKTHVLKNDLRSLKPHATTLGGSDHSRRWNQGQ